MILETCHLRDGAQSQTRPTVSGTLDFCSREEADIRRMIDNFCRRSWERDERAKLKQQTRPLNSWILRFGLGTTPEAGWVDAQTHQKKAQPADVNEQQPEVCWSRHEG